MEVLKSVKVALAISVISFAVIISCNNPVTSPHEGEVSFTVSHLPVLPDGLTYEGWIVYPNGIQSVGKFRVNNNGEYSGTAKALNLGSMVGFEISIEPENDSSEDISGVVVLGGDFENDSSSTLTLTPWSQYALPRIGISDTAMITGKYFLHVYTQTGAPYYEGIWLGEVYSPGQEDSVRKSFNLPTLSDFWDYGAWIKDIQTGQLYLLGRFGDFGAKDSDGPGPYAGANTQNAPDLPGGEFVSATTPPVLNNGNYQLLITLQPKFVSDSLLPIEGLPILVTSNIPSGAGDLENISVSDSLSLNWTGTVVRKY